MRPKDREVSSGLKSLDEYPSNESEDSSEPSSGLGLGDSEGVSGLSNAERFGERGRLDLVQDFNHLRQEGSVMDYHAKFEELKFMMLNKNPSVTEEYFVSSFTGGLNDELRSKV